MRWRGEINKAEERITGQRKSLTTEAEDGRTETPALQPHALPTPGILLSQSHVNPVPRKKPEKDNPA